MLQSWSKNALCPVYTFYIICNVCRSNAVAVGRFEIIFKYYALRPSYYYVLKSLKFLCTLLSEYKLYISYVYLYNKDYI